MKVEEKFVFRLIEEINKNPKFLDKDFFKLKNKFSEENTIPNVKNLDLVEAYRKLEESGEVEKNKKIERLISVRKIRSESGVAVITCLTKPFPCPGKCTFCPSEENMPKSYLSNQPAAMRAVLNKFDPFSQTQNRLASLMATGHDTSKIEIIIIGGTWSYLPLDYQEQFIHQVYNGLNQSMGMESIQIYGGFFKAPKVKQTEFTDTLEQALEKNEKARHRCVGLTLETRPDFITEEEIKRFRRYGCTRVELGVQTLFDSVLEKTKRGHDKEAVVKAVQLLKDAGYKISFHLMPGLPGSDSEKDMETVRLTFEDERFKPDLVKFYPCMVVPHSELEKEFKAGKFKALSAEELRPILSKMIELVPRWCRITRLVRDIPSDTVVDGCKIINLRQIVEKEMKEKGIKMQDIRSREIKDFEVKIENVELRRQNYKSAGGDEIFLTFDEKVEDKLISLLRLRIPSHYFTKEKHFLPELENCALIREVHTYGLQTVVGDKDGNTQHFGFGRKLLAEAEKIAKEEYGLSKIAVIAGTGVREYYEKNGYKKMGTYMVKSL